MERVRAMATDFTERALLRLPDTQARAIAERVLRRIFCRLLKQLEKIHYL